MDTIYRSHLEYISAQRLRAATVRAGEDGPFEAAAILWDAARAEARALRSLAAPTPETRLRSAVEQCGLLIEARAASAVVFDRWPEVIERAQDVDRSVATALCARLRGAVDRLNQETARVTSANPRIARVTETIYTRDAAERDAAIPELRRYLEWFPGDHAAWFNLAVLCHLARADRAAYDAIARTRRLDPELATAREFEVGFAIGVLPPAELRRLIDEPIRDVFGGSADADLAYVVAVALVQLTSEGGRADLLQAARVCEKGLIRATRWGETWRYLRATRSIIDDLLAGRAPRPDAFDDVGLLKAGRHAREVGALGALRSGHFRVPAELAIAV